MFTLQETIQPSADLRLLEILAKSEDDVRNGRVAPISDTFHNLHAMLILRKDITHAYMV